MAIAGLETSSNAKRFATNCRVCLLTRCGRLTEGEEPPKGRPRYFDQFRACYLDEALGSFEGAGDVAILLELRFREDEQIEIFTVHDETEARTLNDLVRQMDGLIELRIPRLVPVEYNGTTTIAKFTEVYRASASNKAFEDTVKAVLEIDSHRWESPWTDFLEDAVHELHAAATPWRFRTCITCVFSSHPTPYGNSDLLRWCYRDSPDAKEWKTRDVRELSGSRAFTGHYWVRAFHRCSAWRPDKVSGK